MNIVLSDGRTISSVFHNNNIWFTQNIIAQALRKSRSGITGHITEIKKEVGVSVLMWPILAANGKVYKCKHYDFKTFCAIAVKARNPDIVKELLDLTDMIDPINFKLTAKEYRFRELIEKTLQGICRVEHQHKIDNYFVDFYFPAIGLVVEYDEVAHKNYKNDAGREDDIMQHSTVAHIIRVKESCEIEGLNEVLKYIVDHINDRRQVGGIV